MKKLVNSFLMFGLLLSSFTGIQAVEEIVESEEVIEEQPNENNHSPSVSEFLFYETVEKEYLNHEEIALYLKVKLASNDSVTRDVTIDIELPREFVERNSIVLTDMEGQKSVGVIDDEINNLYIIRYSFDTIIEGVSMDIPIKFSTEKGMTSQGQELRIDGSIRNNENKDLISPVTHSFTIVNQRNKFNATVSDSTRHDIAYNGGVESSDKEGYLSDDLGRLVGIPFSFIVSSNDYRSTLGTRTIRDFEVTHILPKEAEFVPEDNKLWTYDKESHTASYTQTYVHGLNIGYLNFKNIMSLSLKFPGAQTNKLMTHKVLLKMTPINGNPETESITL